MIGAWIRRKYYSFQLYTGSYALNIVEKAGFNAIVLALFLLILKYTVIFAINLVEYVTVK
jgi:hypothetical protein